MRIGLFGTLLILSVIANAQNKKDLEEKVITLESEKNDLRNNLTATINSLNMLTIKNAELEKQLKEESDMLK